MLLDILRDSIGYSSKKLLSFEFAGMFRFWFWVSRYIMRLNQTAEWNVIAFWLCTNLSFFISSVSIYCRTQSEIRVKSYCRLNLHGASDFNFECIDILQDSIKHSSKMLLPLEFAWISRFLFQMSRYTAVLNQKFE